MQNYRDSRGVEYFSWSEGAETKIGSRIVLDREQRYYKCNLCGELHLDLMVESNEFAMCPRCNNWLTYGKLQRRTA